MPRWIRRRSTYANVIATLALCLALNVGAYAAFKIPPNSIGSAPEEQGRGTEEGVALGDQALPGQEGPKGARGSRGVARCRRCAGP